MTATDFRPVIRRYLSMAQHMGELPAQVVDDVMAKIELHEAKYLTRKEAAEHLRCSLMHLDRLVKKGIITKHYLSKKRPLFIESEINMIVLPNKRKEKWNHEN